jgi:hypothetical protein
MIDEKYFSLLEKIIGEYCLVNAATYEILIHHRDKLYNTFQKDYRSYMVYVLHLQRKK